MLAADDAGADQLGRANRRLALLADATSGLLRTDDPGEYVRQVYDALEDHLDLAAYFNFLVDAHAEGPRLRLDSYAGVPAEVARGFEWLAFGSAVCGVVAEERRARIIDDVQRSTDPVTALIRSLGITAYASFPLIADDRLVGTLSFGLRGAPAFQADDLGLLRAIADQVAVAIDRAETRAAEHQARRAAERASAAQGQLLSTMTHELRTPLTAIVGLAELMQGESTGPVTDRQARHLERIKTAAWHVVSLIDEVLAYFRSDAGRLEVQDEEVDASGLASEVLGVLAGKAEMKGLELRMAGPARAAIVRTDPGKVRQVLTNLVGNAIRYTDDGVVELAVEAADDWILYRVRDTGRGIAEESFEHIFEPFVQLADAGPASRGGTGLGLAVSRRLARRLGGDVHVDSEVGRGSTFTLRLPAG
jgi:signal transduction histidine kinase